VWYRLIDESRKTACTIKELLSQFSIFENGPDPATVGVAVVKMGNGWGGTC
jgi:hypothetical protein